MDHDDNKFKAELLDLFTRIDEVLTRNDIIYFGVYGTCIGALRHNGIIPWDDDIDIAISRNDFEKALSCLNKEGREMIAGTSKTLSCCPTYFGRVFNRVRQDSSIERKRAYIDIYIIDRCDDSKFLFLLRAFCCTGLRRILQRRHGHVGRQHPLLYGLADLFLLPFRILSSRAVEKLQEKTYLSARGKKYIRLTGGSMMRRYIAADFISSIRVKFHDTTIPVPVGYDSYLTSGYGDWRVPPPIEDRHSHAFTGVGDSWNVSLPSDQERLI